MITRKRCSECIRPICQRQLTLNGCKFRNAEDIPTEIIDLYIINDFKMIDQFMG